MDDAENGLGGEIDGRYAPQDDPSDSLAPQGDEHDLPRGERLIKMIGQSAAIFAIDICRYDLEKHGFIIACIRGEAGL